MVTRKSSLNTFVMYEISTESFTTVESINTCLFFLKKVFIMLLTRKAVYVRKYFAVRHF